MKIIALACAFVGLVAQAHSQLLVQVVDDNQVGHVGDLLTYHFEVHNIGNTDIQLTGFDPGLGDPGFSINNNLLGDLYTQTGDFTVYGQSSYYLNAFDVTPQPDALDQPYNGLALLDYSYIDPISGQSSDGTIDTSWNLTVAASPAPEPATYAMLGLGIVALARRRR